MPYLGTPLHIQLREKLSDAGVNVGRLDTIDHSSCPEDPDLVVRPSDWFGGAGDDVPAEGGEGAGGEGEATNPEAIPGPTNPDENEVF